MKCQICGCTDNRPCIARVQGRDGAVYESPCAWLPVKGDVGPVCTCCWPAWRNPEPIVPAYLTTPEDP